MHDGTDKHIVESWSEKQDTSSVINKFFLKRPNSLKVHF